MHTIKCTPQLQLRLSLFKEILDYNNYRYNKNTHLCVEKKETYLIMTQKDSLSETGGMKFSQEKSIRQLFFM